MSWSLKQTEDGGPAVRIVSRQEWGAVEPRTGPNDDPIETIKLPCQHVNFTHTGTYFCNTDEECVKVVRLVQFEMMDEMGLADIGHSFLVGGNGVVYEGRGWDKEPFRPFMFDYLEGKGIEIAYIGEYDEVGPAPVMLRAAFDLVLYGIKSKFIRPNFKSFHLQ